MTVKETIGAFGYLLLRLAALLGAAGFLVAWYLERGTFQIHLALICESVSMLWAAGAPTHRRLSRNELLVTLLVSVIFLWATATLLLEDRSDGNVEGAVVRIVFLAIYVAIFLGSPLLRGLRTSDTVGSH